MKVSFPKRVRRAIVPAVGLAALGTLTVGCGDKESNPDAVTVQELKGPGALKIWDKGSGAVMLQWSGSNNEDDFDGYNVYGMKNDSAGKIAAGEGKAVELLDDKGEAVQAAKDYMALFNYDPEKKLEAAGDATNSDGEAEFSALPIHSKDGDTRLLPTCKPNGTAGTCDATTTASKDKKGVEGGVVLNGDTKYDVSGLTVGDKYCFFVLSSIDGGQKVSQTSSNVKCVEPTYAASFNMTLPASAAANQKFDMRTWLTSCTAAGCPDPTASSPKTLDVAENSVSTLNGNTRSHFGQDVEPVYIEYSDAGPAFVPGKNSSVIDLGYYASGLSDTTLPEKAPTLTIDSDTYNPADDANRKSPVYNAGGYAIPGQSVPVLANHVYVFAVGAKGDTAPTKFAYHWMYVKGAVTGASVAVEMRVSKNEK